MDLLSASERNEIRLAIQDATDTFCHTPCTIKVRIDNADRLGRQANIYFEDYVVNGLVEFGHLQSDQVFLNEDGSVIRADIKLTINVEDMEAVELLNSENQAIINMATDKIVCYGVEYRIVLLALDGALGPEDAKDKNLICIIMGNREPTNT